MAGKIRPANHPFRRGIALSIVIAKARKKQGNDFDRLWEAAKLLPPSKPTDEQRADFAYGQVAMGNPDVTPEMCAEAARKIRPK